MILPLFSIGKPLNPITLKIPKPPLRKSVSGLRNPIICSFSHPQNPISKLKTKPKTHVGFEKIMKKNRGFEEGRGFSLVGDKQKWVLLCGIGYWVQGFRCFPWLALNFHMAHYLNLHPSTLQLVQNFSNLPMVAKPLFGVLSDVLPIDGAHRIPYISIGVLLQVLSWGSLALIPVAGEALPTLMACVLLSNLGASVTEVAKDALVAEYGHKHKIGGLQSYAFMASVAGGILGNLLGGCFLMRTQPRTMFLIFIFLLSLQLAISSSTTEHSLILTKPSDPGMIRKSILESINKQFSDLMAAIGEESIFRPLAWIVASISMVPVLSGSVFCYQMQCLQLDPSIIGMSRVTGQLMLLSTTILYDRYWKKLPMRKLIGAVQILYASTLLLDFILVKQINLKLGIPNEIFALCFSSLAETIAQFKLLPFTVLFSRLCPQGCEGSLISLLASALCLSSIVSGFLGVGLASLIGITSDNYSSLPVGILIQFIAALIPLVWISHLPMSEPTAQMEKKIGVSRRTRRNRRIGRVVYGSVFAYRRERESEAER